MLFGVFAFYGNMRMKAKVLVWTILLHHHVPSKCATWQLVAYFAGRCFAFAPCQRNTVQMIKAVFHILWICCGIELCELGCAFYYPPSAVSGVGIAVTRHCSYSHLRGRRGTIDREGESDRRQHIGMQTVTVLVRIYRD